MEVVPIAKANFVGADLCVCPVPQRLGSRQHLVQAMTLEPVRMAAVRNVGKHTYRPCKVNFFCVFSSFAGHFTKDKNPAFIQGFAFSKDTIFSSRFHRQ